MFLRRVHHFESLNFGLTLSKTAIMSQECAILINQLRIQKLNTWFVTVYCHKITFQLLVFLS